jgi:hypothetical protein
VFHPAGDDPYWSESGWFGFSVHEHDINGFVYYFHDTRTGWPGRMTFWTLTKWQWDGVQGYGEDQEFFAREQVRGLIGPYEGNMS